MEYLGYFAAVLIGILLGLIGAGGSILTIPVLVYLIGIEPVNATSYSLFIVGVSAFIGGLRYLKNNMICLKTMMVWDSFGYKHLLHPKIFITCHTGPLVYHRFYGNYQKCCFDDFISGIDDCGFLFHDSKTIFSKDGFAQTQ